MRLKIKTSEEPRRMQGALSQIGAAAVVRWQLGSIKDPAARQNNGNLLHVVNLAAGRANSRIIGAPEGANRSGASP